MATYLYGNTLSVYQLSKQPLCTKHLMTVLKVAQE